MVDDYLSRVYAGFLGMNIGIRLGAPVEPTIWTYERIHNTYGEITNYVKDFKNFAADDDVNGPFYFLRAMYDKPAGSNLTANNVADAWLNYSREGLGMFWWGGYGVSTEHTAFLNLKNGIPAPKSGSIKQNGKTLAEQIGGQIFIDTWGLINPGRPEIAAEYGEIAASVSHDGEGVYGARFFCAAIAAAFEEKNPAKLVEIGLSQIPSDSTYAAVSRAVINFHKENPEDWRACRKMLADKWGYDKYPGVCHIIPNAGVCIMALLYSEGDFSKSVEIATMAGWDTDCNAGNVGTVMGLACGLSNLPEKYRAPMNDFLVLSGISGYLNIMDIPSYAKELALLGYHLAGENAPEALQNSFKPGEVYFDFELPGSTHGMRISDSFFCKIKQSTEYAHSGTGSLEILFDRMSRGEQCRLFYKPFYTRNDFSDERYSPAFSPTVYSGQTLRAKFLLEQWNGWETIGLAPYVRTCSKQQVLQGGYVKMQEGQWLEITYVVPDTNGDLIDEIGFIIEGYAPAKSKSLGRLFMDEFSVNGKAEYSIDVKKQQKEFGVITPFLFNHGARDIVDGRIMYMRCEPAFAFGGNYYSENYEFSAELMPVNGESHLLLARAKGELWGYAAGFTKKGEVAICKNNKGHTLLANANYNWEYDRAYKMMFSTNGTNLQLFIDGEHVLSANDDSFASGMYGFGSLETGRTYYSDFKVKEI